MGVMEGWRNGCHPHKSRKQDREIEKSFRKTRRTHMILQPFSNGYLGVLSSRLRRSISITARLSDHSGDLGNVFGTAVRRWHPDGNRDRIKAGAYAYRAATLCFYSTLMARETEDISIGSTDGIPRAQTGALFTPFIAFHHHIQMQNWNIQFRRNKNRSLVFSMQSASSEFLSLYCSWVSVERFLLFDPLPSSGVEIKRWANLMTFRK